MLTEAGIKMHPIDDARNYWRRNKELLGGLCYEPSISGGACDGYFRRGQLAPCIPDASDDVELRCMALRGGCCNLLDMP